MRKERMDYVIHKLEFNIGSINRDKIFPLWIAYLDVKNKLILLYLAEVKMSLWLSNN